ncbi:MAG: putative ABC transporter permease [Coriobacteriales bacterium]|nr:putative ABC transporter permease [Coriobacteriales bacterium]
MLQRVANLPLSKSGKGGPHRSYKTRSDYEAERDAYLQSLKLGWYQITIVFCAWSIVGLFLEETWIRVSMGLAQSRAGLVWGPFSPLYGVGAVILTALALFLFKRGCSMGLLFVSSMLMGALLEQTAGWGMQTFFGAVSWDYIAGGIPGALTQWVCLPFMLMWGVLGCVWGRVVMPNLLFAIGEPSTRLRMASVALLAVFLVADIALTLLCFERVVERKASMPPSNRLEQLVDKRFNDTFVSQRFQNMWIAGVNEHPFGE